MNKRAQNYNMPPQDEHLLDPSSTKLRVAKLQQYAESRGSKVQGFNNSSSIRVSCGSQNVGRVSASNDMNAFKLISSNQSGVSGKIEKNKLENFLSATQLELRSKQALMNPTDGVGEYGKKSQKTGPASSQNYHEIFIRSTKNSHQIKLSESFSPKRPVINASNQKTSPSRRELSLTQINSQKSEKLTVQQMQQSQQVSSVNDKSTIMHNSMKDSMMTLGGGGHHNRQFTLQNRIMQPTLQPVVTGQQFLINQRVATTTMRGGPKHRRSRDRGYYMGAKDLLGVKSAGQQKDVVLGIGAANNRFRRNIGLKQAIKQSTQQLRRNSRPSYSKTETISPSPQTYDNIIDDQFNDNLESRLDQWTQKVGHKYQIMKSNVSHGGSRTRSRAQIRAERKNKENMKTENGIIYRKEGNDEMQRQILPSQIQALQDQMDSRILSEGDRSVNNYYETFKLKKVTLELDENQFFDQDPDFQKYMNQEQQQKSKAGETMNKTQFAGLSKGGSIHLPGKKTRPMTCHIPQSISRHKNKDVNVGGMPVSTGSDVMPTSKDQQSPAMGSSPGLFHGQVMKPVLNIGNLGGTTSHGQQTMVQSASEKRSHSFSGNNFLGQKPRNLSSAITATSQSQPWYQRQQQLRIMKKKQEILKEHQIVHWQQLASKASLLHTLIDEKKNAMPLPRKIITSQAKTMKDLSPNGRGDSRDQQMKDAFLSYQARSIDFSSQRGDIFGLRQKKINNDVAMVQYSTMNSHHETGDYDQQHGSFTIHPDKMRTGPANGEEDVASQNMSFHDESNRRCSMDEDNTQSMLLPGHATDGPPGQNIITLNFEGTARKASRRNSTSWKQSQEDRSSVEEEINGIDEQTQSIEKAGTAQISPGKQKYSILDQQNEDNETRQVVSTKWRHSSESNLMQQMGGEMGAGINSTLKKRTEREDHFPEDTINTESQAIGVKQKYSTNPLGGISIKMSKVDENIRSHSIVDYDKSKEEQVTQIAKNESMKAIENEMMGDNFNDIQVEDLEALITTVDGVKTVDNRAAQEISNTLAYNKKSHQSNSNLIDSSSRVYRNQSDYIDRFKELEMRNLQVLSDRVTQAIQNRIDILHSYNQMFVQSRTNSPHSNDVQSHKSIKSNGTRRTVRQGSNQPTLYIKPDMPSREQFGHPKTAQGIVNMVLKKAGLGAAIGANRHSKIHNKYFQSLNNRKASLESPKHDGQDGVNMIMNSSQSQPISFNSFQNPDQPKSKSKITKAGQKKADGADHKKGSASAPKKKDKDQKDQKEALNSTVKLKEKFAPIPVKELFCGKNKSAHDIQKRMSRSSKSEIRQKLSHSRLNEDLSNELGSIGEILMHKKCSSKAIGLLTLDQESYSDRKEEEAKSPQAMLERERRKYSILRKLGAENVTVAEAHGYDKKTRKLLDNYISQVGHFDPEHQLELIKQKTAALDRVFQPLDLLHRVEKDIKSSSQIASRLVTSVDKMPLIRIGLPLDVEIIPDLKMLFLCKVKGQPSPLMLKIKYQNNRKLTVATTLSESDAKDIVYSERAQNMGAHLAPRYGGSVQFYQDPDKIFLSTLGIQQQKYRVQSKQSDELDFKKDKEKLKLKRTLSNSGNGTGANGGGSGAATSAQESEKKKKQNGKTFNENNMYIIFHSSIQITVTLELSVPQSVDQINKEKLKQKKLEARQKLDDIEDQFLPENNPYVVEMLQKERERKRKLREFEEKLTQKRREIIMQTPQSNKVITFGQSKNRLSRATARAHHTLKVTETAKSQQKRRSRDRLVGTTVPPKDGSINDLQLPGFDESISNFNSINVPIDMFYLKKQ